MRNRLSGKFTLNHVCKFAWPTIIMAVFMSMYTMVDGAFVAKLIGTDALSAVNITMPFIYFYFGVAVMFATGASAIVAADMGRGENRKARQNFSFMLIVAIVAGFALAAIGVVFAGQMVHLLGAAPEVAAYSREYLGTLAWFIPLAMLQVMFQTFFIAAGRPAFGLTVVVLGGIVNIVLDYVFIATMGMGVGGAALATGIGYSIPSLAGLLYFSLARRDALALTRPKVNWRVLFASCTNGASEMVTNLSMAIVTFLFNLLMLRYLGVDGVAAITIVLYAEYLFTSIYFGFSSGVAPLFSYIYGKNDPRELKALFKTSLTVIGAFSAIAIGVSLVLAGNIVTMFAPEGGLVYGYAVHGFRLHALCFLFMGFNIFASALFTALSNGKISALLSFLRTFVFLVASLLILPRWLGVDGIWLAVPVAEALSIGISIVCMVRLRNMYQYA